jgi:hypothetical protein
LKQRLKELADSYLDHIRIAVEARDRGAPFRDFFDNWNAFHSEFDHHRSRSDRPRWFNNPSATKRLAMLESLDFVSEGAAEIIRQSRLDPDGYDRRYGSRDVSVRLIVDHSVPIGVMADMLFDPQDGERVKLTRDGIRAHLLRWYRLGLLSHAENSRLNSSGIGSKMPPDWDRTDVFARYRVAEIVSPSRLS